MNPIPATSVASPGKTLRRLFLTVFLRGRSSRGLQKEAAPKSVGQKLALTLLFYALFGCFGFFFINQPVFALSVYLHAMTFVFLGMFVAASAGEILFNKEEADILLHRPITPRALLWAKIGVLVQVSLWLAGAFNLAGIFVGIASKDGGWLFPAAHALSTVLEALFCTGCVVLVYQLCLRWFGRERLDGLMTTAQVFLGIAAVLASQIVPRVMLRFDKAITVNVDSWWIGLLPPAWFAGIDDAIAGQHLVTSWILAGIGLVTTVVVLWLAFEKLAGDYATGLQTLQEAVSTKPKQNTRRRWIHTLVSVPPLSWWLRDSIERASFLLATAYLFRDRDVKLRIYPGVAPMLVMPIIFLLQETSRKGSGGDGGFGIAFSGAFIGIIPMLGMNLLQYSQQWQAADLFRMAPMEGPSALCNGARRAVLLILTLPLLLSLAVFAWFTRHDSSRLFLLLPGVITLPVFAMVPCLGGKAVPLSQPTEEAKSASRGLTMMGAMFASMAVAGVASVARAGGWFIWFLAIEAIFVAGLYVGMRASLARARWQAVE
jgi:ABC-2 type transport system permease protein